MARTQIRAVTLLLLFAAAGACNGMTSNSAVRDGVTGADAQAADAGGTGGSKAITDASTIESDSSSGNAVSDGSDSGAWHAAPCANDGRTTYAETLCGPGVTGDCIPPTWRDVLARVPPYSTCEANSGLHETYLAQCGAYHAIVDHDIYSAYHYYEPSGRLVGFTARFWCNAYDASFKQPDETCHPLDGFCL